MRAAFVGLFVAPLVALLTSSPVHAIGDTTALLNLQEECAQVGDISFGSSGRWADCQVTRGRWISTIDLIDMYQTQYCLGSGQGTCEQRALLLFGNRAYTPGAKLLFQRIDPATVTYDDPLVVKNDYGYLLTVSTRLADGDQSNNYFLWQARQWIPVNSQGWLKDLAKRLPAGVAARKGGWPSMDTMSAKVRLYHKGEADCCASAGVANVELRLTQKRLSLTKVTFSNEAASE